MSASIELSCALLNQINFLNDEVQQAAYISKQESLVYNEEITTIQEQVKLLCFQAEGVDAVSIETIKENIYGIEKTIPKLKQRLEFLSHCELDQEALNLVLKAQDVADSVFERDSHEVRFDIDLLSRQIEELSIRSEMASRQLLQRARDFLQNSLDQLAIKQQYEEVHSFQTDNNSLIITGANSQFTGTANGLGNSACPIIALIALKKMLRSQIRDGAQIDQITQKGIEEYGNAISRIEKYTGEPFEYGTHIDWDQHIMAMPEFEQADKIIGVNLSENTEDDYFNALLEFANCLEICQKKGGTLTIPPETYAITIERKDDNFYEVCFFDSHGHYDTTGTRNAYLMRFLTIHEASEFLAKRRPYVQLGV